MFRWLWTQYVFAQVIVNLDPTVPDASNSCVDVDALQLCFCSRRRIRQRRRWQSSRWWSCRLSQDFLERNEDLVECTLGLARDEVGRFWLSPSLRDPGQRLLVETSTDLWKSERSASERNDAEKKESAPRERTEGKGLSAGPCKNTFPCYQTRR